MLSSVIAQSTVRQQSSHSSVCGSALVNFSPTGDEL